MMKIITEKFEQLNMKACAQNLEEVMKMAVVGFYTGENGWEVVRW